MKESVLKVKSKEFAIRIIKLYKYLEKKKEFCIANQIMRSGTSIGANVAEGYYAQSASDFVAKYTIALKEASETAYWLELLRDCKMITSAQYNDISKDCLELIKLLTTSIKTAKKKK